MGCASVPRMQPADGSTLLLALHKAKVDVSLPALDICFATLVSGAVGNTLPAGVQVGGQAVPIRCETRRHASRESLMRDCALRMCTVRLHTQWVSDYKVWQSTSDVHDVARHPQPVRRGTVLTE